VTNKEYQRAYYLANREKVLARTGARSKAWHAENPGKASIIAKDYASRNKEKIAARKRAYTETNRDVIKERAKCYCAENRDIRLEKARQWHAANKDAVLSRKAAANRANPGRACAYTRKRDAQKLMAIPRWADHGKILVLYEEAARLTKETGVKHHVDHIVPLQGKNVCGLHWEGNLRVIPASENYSKHNKLLLAA
jgi:hypothetical protein